MCVAIPTRFVGDVAILLILKVPVCILCTGIRSFWEEEEWRKGEGGKKRQAARGNP